MLESARDQRRQFCPVLAKNYHRKRLYLDDAMREAISLKTIVTASKENVSCALGDEEAILDMRSGKYYGLDPIGASIWKLIAQPKSVEELRAVIVEEYEVDPAKCESDLLLLLERLRTEGLIKTSDV